MSFTTATVLLALLEADEAGLDVPARLVEGGTACLAAMRDDSGNFEYLRLGDAALAGPVNPQASAARGPVCTLALIRSGKLKPDSIVPALESYIQFLPAFGDEARKALMHAGPAAQGSHYLLYDYSTAADAIRACAGDEVPSAVRNRARTEILRQLGRCRNADGSFMDNPLIGCQAGTGLAAFALVDLLAEKPGAD
jgi:hypothetical protein